MPNVKWREQRHPSYGERETWFARYRGWTLYAGRVARSCGNGFALPEAWRAALHRFRADGTADMPYCEQWYPTLEGAQNAAEFYAEHGRFPHADGHSSRVSSVPGIAR